MTTATAPKLYIGHVDSRAFCALADLSAAIEYLTRHKQAGRALRWTDEQLHTFAYRGKQAFTLFWARHVHDTQARQLSESERETITAALDSYAVEQEQTGRFRYRYVSEMLAMYRKAFDHLKADPANTVRLRWSDSPMGLAEFRAEFRRALDRRINSKAGLNAPRGRKDTPEYQAALFRDSRRVRDILTRRMRVYQFETDEARRRFAHLLASYDD